MQKANWKPSFKKRKFEKAHFSDLRAIPFVGSWSQSNRMYLDFGVGTALKSYDQDGNFNKVTKLYQQSSFLERS